MGVIIGMDPHKRSATIEVIDEAGRRLAGGRFGTDKAGYAELLAAGRRHSRRVWAVEGCNGIGKHIAHRLVHDGEMVFDVPAKLSAQVRVFATGNGRKTDPVDARSVALAALYAPADPGLRRLEVDDDLVVMGLLVDRRDELGRARTQTINRLHRLLLELFPGGAKQFLSAPQARALIATTKPRDLVGKTRRRLAVELVTELEAIDKKIKTAEKDLAALVTERGSTLMDLTGIGPTGAARLLADVGDIHRFADKDRFASWNGTAPLDASSGAQQRHRLSRAGNRRINRTLHIMAVVQLRNPTPGREFYDTRKAGGTPSLMAMRALKRRLSNIVYARMVADQNRRDQSPATGPGGQQGNDSVSSAADSQPHTGSSDKPLPGPAKPQPKPRCGRQVDTEGAMCGSFGNVLLMRLSGLVSHRTRRTFMGNASGISRGRSKPATQDWPGSGSGSANRCRHHGHPGLMYNQMVVGVSVDEALDSLFHALADATRRDIVRRCIGGESSVSALAAAYPMSFAAVQKHVALLQRAGLVSKERRGREQLVRTDVDAVRRARRALDQLETVWRGRVDRMARLLEEVPDPDASAQRRGPRR